MRQGNQVHTVKPTDITREDVNVEINDLVIQGKKSTVILLGITIFLLHRVSNEKKQRMQ